MPPRNRQDAALKSLSPTLEHERAWAAAGLPLVAGVDEVGRGAWAGPVVAAAVILPPKDRAVHHLADVRDSKLMTPRARVAALAAIREVALGVGVGIVEADEVDAQGILPATRKAMLAAVAALPVGPDALLVDHVVLPGPLPQRAFPRADQLCLSVAAASVVAKVTRDRLMVEYDGQFPGYGFAHHKGYGTAFHAAALHALGPCRLHRCSFAPVSAVQLTLDMDV